MITASSDVRQLRRAPTGFRRLPVGLYWLAALALSLALWATLIGAAYSLFW
jgi:hypothetical protein